MISHNFTFLRFYSTLAPPPPPRVTRPPSVKLHQKRSFNQSFSSTLSDGSECMYFEIYFRISFFWNSNSCKKGTFLLRGKKSQRLILSTCPKTRYSIPDLSVFWLILLLFKKENWNYSHTLYLLTRYYIQKILLWRNNFFWRTQQ